MLDPLRLEHRNKTNVVHCPGSIDEEVGLRILEEIRICAVMQLEIQHAISS
jgi:hypothetical protein